MAAEVPTPTQDRVSLPRHQTVVVPTPCASELAELLRGRLAQQWLLALAGLSLEWRLEQPLVPVVRALPERVPSFSPPHAAHAHVLGRVERVHRHLYTHSPSQAAAQVWEAPQQQLEQRQFQRLVVERPEIEQHRLWASELLLVQEWELREPL